MPIIGSPTLNSGNAALGVGGKPVKAGRLWLETRWLD